MLDKITRRVRKAATGRYGRIITRGKEMVWQAADPTRSRARFRVGRELANSQALNIRQEDGYAMFDKNSFGGTAGIVAAGREIMARYEASPPVSTVRKKEYFHNIMDPADLDRYPAIMSFALNKDLLASLSAYYGTLPELCSLGLMLSRPSEKLKGSQLAHFDAYDSHHVKVIVAVEDVTTENGALEFIPADKSAEVAEKLGRKHSANIRCEDEKLVEIVDRRDFIAAAVNAGDGAVLDTSTCLHFGSRVSSGRRLMWFIHFATFAAYEKMEQTANGSILFQNLSEKRRFASDVPQSLALAL